MSELMTFWLHRGSVDTSAPHSKNMLVCPPMLLCELRMFETGVSKTQVQYTRAQKTFWNDLYSKSAGVWTEDAEPQRLQVDPGAYL